MVDRQTRQPAGLTTLSRVLSPSIPYQDAGSASSASRIGWHCSLMAGQALLSELISIPGRIMVLSAVVADHLKSLPSQSGAEYRPAYGRPLRWPSLHRSAQRVERPRISTSTTWSRDAGDSCSFEQVCAQQQLVATRRDKRLGVRLTFAPTLEDFATRCGSSITLLHVRATRTPTPGAIISRFTASSVRAIVMRRRLRMAKSPIVAQSHPDRRLHQRRVSCIELAMLRKLRCEKPAVRGDRALDAGKALVAVLPL
jgi:hypothetical protein